MADATFELYEVERGYPELMVASATGEREAALREINHYAMMYGQDGPVKIVEAPEPPQ